MIDLKQKYSIFEKIYDWPRIKWLIDCREWYKKDPNSIKNIDELLLNNAIVYFWKQYIERVIETLWEDSNWKLKSEVAYSNDMIQDILLDVWNVAKIIIELDYRDYQVSAIKFLEEYRWDKNLVIMPTWYWKTIVSFKEITEQLKLWRKVVFSAPTNNLVHQQYEDFLDYVTYFLQDKKLANNTSLSTKDNADVYFVTNHVLDIWIEEKKFDDSFFYIVDEAHEWEWKEWEEDREYKYPTMQAFNKLESDNYTLLALSATPLNFPILEEKLWIKNVFYWSYSEYFVQKNRELNFSSDENFDVLNDIIMEAINSDLDNIEKYIVDYKNSDKASFDDKKLLSNYTRSKLKSKVYFDASLIKKLEEVFDKKLYDDFYGSLWNYKKILEIKKKLYQNEYSTLNNNIDEEFCKDLEQKIQELTVKRSKIQSLINSETDNWKLSTYYSDRTKVNNNIQKIAANINKKLYLLKKNYKVKDLLVKIRSKLEEYSKNTILHPKVNTLFEILKSNKYFPKTTIVHVENEQVIRELVSLSVKYWFKASYLKWWTKNKTNKFVDSYTKENIWNENLDVVFVTSVFKLWVNFDINNLVFYHPPKNIKDLLQFEWRVWRYSKLATIYYLWIDWWFEVWKVYSDIRNAKKYLNEQFEKAEEEKNIYNEKYNP